jgi:hypothetical protein
MVGDKMHIKPLDLDLFGDRMRCLRNDKMTAWRTGGHCAFYATAFLEHGVRYHLTVERMVGKDTRWEWITWCSTQLIGWIDYGYTTSSREAMRTAERAVSSRIRECDLSQGGPTGVGKSGDVKSDDLYPGRCIPLSPVTVRL